MSKTAIVVSGILRHLEHASKSWMFNGDYYLIAEEAIYKSHVQEPIGKATPAHLVSKVAFTSATICDSTIPLSMVQNRNKSLVAYGPAQMAWKWKVAYQQLLASNLHYDRVVLLRPDIWIYKNNGDAIDNMFPKNNEIYSMAGYQPDITPNRGYTTMGDVFMMMNLHTFGILAKFYDYVIMNYDNLVIMGKHDIHSLLAKYLLESGIELNDWLGHNYGFIVLRGNSDYMFDDNGLKDGYTILDLINKQIEWWNNLYG